MFPVRLYVTDLPEDDAFYDGWYELMPQGRQKRCDRFRLADDRHRCIAAYALLVHALAGLAADHPEIFGQDMPGNRLDIKEDANGKPYIPGSSVCFNISHSGLRVAVAVSPQNTGCDVECRSRNAVTIAGRFFAEEESSFISSLDDETVRDIEFTKLWTLKESVVKCLGEGIRHRLDDFSLVDKEGIRKNRICIGDAVLFVREYESENGYCYSCCSEHEEIEECVRHISSEEITRGDKR